MTCSWITSIWFPAKPGTLAPTHSQVGKLSWHRLAPAGTRWHRLAPSKWHSLRTTSLVNKGKLCHSDVATTTVMQSNRVTLKFLPTKSGTTLVTALTSERQENQTVAPSGTECALSNHTHQHNYAGFLMNLPSDQV